MSVGTFLFGLFACAWVLSTRSVLGIMGWHAGWNWLLAIGFGLPVTGLDVGIPALLLDLQPVGPDWLTGGPQGPEASFVCFGYFVLGIDRCGFSPEGPASHPEHWRVYRWERRTGTTAGVDEPDEMIVGGEAERLLDLGVVRRLAGFPGGDIPLTNAVTSRMFCAAAPAARICSMAGTLVPGTMWQATTMMSGARSALPRSRSRSPSLSAGTRRSADAASISPNFRRWSPSMSMNRHGRSMLMVRRAHRGLQHRGQMVFRGCGVAVGLGGGCAWSALRGIP